MTNSEFLASLGLNTDKPWTLYLSVSSCDPRDWAIAPQQVDGFELCLTLILQAEGWRVDFERKDGDFCYQWRPQGNALHTERDAYHSFDWPPMTQLQDFPQLIVALEKLWHSRFSKQVYLDGNIAGDTLQQPQAVAALLSWLGEGWHLSNG